MYCVKSDASLRFAAAAAALVLISWLAIVPSQSAHAQSGTLLARQERQAFQFDLPAQSLTKALTAFASATGVRLAYSAVLTNNLDTAELRGRFTREEALTRLLNGTGITYRFTDEKTVTLSGSGNSQDA